MPEPLKTRSGSAVNPPEGYRMTELGPLPKEWRIVRMNEVVTITRKPRSFQPPSEVAFIPMDAIPNDGGLYPKNIISKLAEKVPSGIYCEGRDILFAKITPSLENGKQCFVPPNIKYAYATTEVYPLKAGKQIDEIFLFLYLRAPWIRKRLAEKMEGSTGRQRLPKQALMSLPLPLPPLPEQRAIAHVLRTVQESKEATEKVISALRELKKSLMRHLFTHGPTPINQRDQAQIQRTKIGPIPIHWKVTPLKEIARLRKGQVSPDNFPQTRYVGLEHLDSGEIKIKRFGGTEDIKSTKAVFKKGDVLYGKLRPYLDKAALAEWEGICSTDILVLQPQQAVLPIFLAYLMHHPMVLHHAVSTTTGVNHPRTSWKALREVLVPLPPLPEQRQIAEILQAVDRKIEAEENRKAALEELFKSLLRELMTAKRRLPKEFIAQFADKPGEKSENEA